MTAAVPEDVATRRRLPVGTLVVRVVAAVLFAYVLWQAIGNTIGVTTTLQQNNAFLRENGGTALQTPVPWAALVVDLLIAPAGYAVAWWVSRRSDVVRTVVVFAAALCAVSALWFTILQYVAATLRFGS